MHIMCMNVCQLIAPALVMSFVVGTVMPFLDWFLRSHANVRPYKTNKNKNAPTPTKKKYVLLPPTNVVPVNTRASSNNKQQQQQQKGQYIIHHSRQWILWTVLCLFKRTQENCWNGQHYCKITTAFVDIFPILTMFTFLFAGLVVRTKECIQWLQQTQNHYNQTHGTMGLGLFGKQMAKQCNRGRAQNTWVFVARTTQCLNTWQLYNTTGQQ